MATLVMLMVFNARALPVAPALIGDPIPSTAASYNVSVAIKMTGSTIGSFGPSCVISTPGSFFIRNKTPILQHHINSAYRCNCCGKTTFTPNLEYYKFQFKNNSPSDPDFGTSYYATTNGYFGYSAGRFSNVDNNGNPIPARAVDYLVSVAIKMNGSPIGSYGNACTITTPGAFQSEIRAQYCGITLNDLTDQIVANTTSIHIRFRIL